MIFFLNLILLLTINCVYGYWGCFKVTGMLKCGTVEYQQAKVYLFDQDGLLKDEKMVPKFGYGTDGFGPERLITYNSALILEGCANDFGTIPDPYLKVSHYRCQGKTKAFKVKINTKQCKYFRGALPKSDGSGFEKAIHQFHCYGIVVDLGMQIVERRVEN